MYFEDIYKPIPPVYNLVLAMLWRHPENIELDEAKVVHYCAAGAKPWRYRYDIINFSCSFLKKGERSETASLFCDQVHRPRREYGERRHQDACREMVGYL